MLSATLASNRHPARVGLTRALGRMKQSTASNIALILAVLAWPLCFYGLLSQLGDYAPGTPSHIIESSRLKSFVALTAGLLSFLSSLWLSGFAFSGAKLRSAAATIASLGLLFTAIIDMRPW